MMFSGVKESRWEKVPCEVELFKVKMSKKQSLPFQPIVSYSYQWQGQTYVGDQVWHGKKGVDQIEEIEELLAKHRNEGVRSCYVNPSNPSEAVLEVKLGESLLVGLAFAIFGAAFVAIGIGIIVAAKKKAGIEALGEQAALSEKVKGSKTGMLIMVPFFSMFALTGIGAMVFLLSGVMKGLDARDWEETPAEVLWSRVIRSNTDDGTTYKADVLYRYHYKGVDYCSNRVKVMSGSSGGRSGKKAFVDKHPRGRKIVCYVNPEKPWQAMLVTSMGASILWLLFPLPFMAIGMGGLVHLFRNKADLPRKSVSNSSGVRLSAGKGKRPAVNAQGPQVFDPSRRRVNAWWICFAFALIWNGIVIIVYRAHFADGFGAADTGAKIFFSLFSMVGVIAIILAVYRFIALFNPSPVVTLADTEIIMGEPMNVQWRVNQGAHKIKQFRIVLIAEEYAEYRRGTDTHSASSVFYEQVLLDTQDRRKISAGDLEILIPQGRRNIAPSWQGKHNAIKWWLWVDGQIGMAPDASDLYEVQVKAIEGDLSK